MKGWVKLHRKLLANPIMEKPELLQLFIYCLLKANHEPGTAFWGKGEIVVERGQFITGRFELSRDLNVNPNTIYKRLQTLRKREFINTESNNKNTLVTVVNYGLYQSEEIKSNTKSNNKVTTKQQQSNTNKNVKNYKNEKNSSSIGPNPFEFFEENMPGMITPMVAEDINNFTDDGFEDEVIIEAMKASIDNGAHNWAYAKKILVNCYQAGILTIKQWEKRQKEYENNKASRASPGKVPQHNNFEQRKYGNDFYDDFFSNTS